jgi:DNA-binding protein H-NS
MATRTNVLQDATVVFRELAVQEQREILLEFQAIYEDALNKRRKELIDELDALGPPTTMNGKAPKAGALRGTRYRSRKDPLLVWSGRGRMARWLVDEMKQTGLPKEAFKVK